MTGLIHGEFRPDLRAAEYVVLPDGWSKADGQRLIDHARDLADLARDAVKAGA